MHGNDVIFRMMNKFFFLFLLIVFVFLFLFFVKRPFQTIPALLTSRQFPRRKNRCTKEFTQFTQWTVGFKLSTLGRASFFMKKTTAPRVIKWGFWHCWIPLESKSEWIILPLTYPSMIYDCLDVTMILIQASPLSQEVFMPVFINKMFESIEIFKHYIKKKYIEINPDG